MEAKLRDAEGRDVEMQAQLREKLSEIDRLEHLLSVGN